MNQTNTAGLPNYLSITGTTTINGRTVEDENDRLLAQARRIATELEAENARLTQTILAVRDVRLWISEHADCDCRFDVERFAGVLSEQLDTALEGLDGEE